MARRDWGSGSVERRGKRRWRVGWECRRCAATGKRGRHRYSVEGTKREAIAALERAKREQRCGGVDNGGVDNGGVDPNRITTGAWLTQWLQGRVKDRRIGSRVEYNYRGIIANHLTPEIGHVRLQDLTPTHILNLKDKLLAPPQPGAARPRTRRSDEGLQHGTVKKILGMLRQALQSAVQQELLGRNPVSAVPMPSPAAEGKTEKRALEETEIKKLLRAVEGTRYDAPVQFALATGARQGEVLGATWNALDLERGTFHVIRALKEENGKLVLGAPKTRRSRRAIALSPETVEMLRRHRAEQDAARLALGAEWKDRRLVFPTKDGEYWHRATLYKGYRQLVNGSGIDRPKEVNFHTLRHTAASQWAKAGVDPLTITRRLGHSSAAFTLDNYAHELIGQQDDAARVFDVLVREIGRQSARDRSG